MQILSVLNFFSLIIFPYCALGHDQIITFDQKHKSDQKKMLYADNRLENSPFDLKIDDVINNSIFSKVKIAYLNIITSERKEVELEIGKKIKLDDNNIIEIKCQKCIKIQNNYYALFDIKTNELNKISRINSWFTSASPSLNDFNHHTYELFLLKCL